MKEILSKAEQGIEAAWQSQYQDDQLDIFQNIQKRTQKGGELKEFVFYEKNLNVVKVFEGRSFVAWLFDGRETGHSCGE